MNLVCVVVVCVFAKFTYYSLCNVYLIKQKIKTKELSDSHLTVQVTFFIVDFKEGY